MSEPENRFQKFIEILESCDGTDPEEEHYAADLALLSALLVAAGDEAKPLIEAWNNIVKWYA